MTNLRNLSPDELGLVLDVTLDRIRADFARAELAAMTWEPAPCPDTYQPTRRTQ